MKNSDKFILKSLIKILKEGKKKSSRKADGMRSVKKGADKNPKVTKMDFLPDDVLKGIADKNKKDMSEKKK